MVVGLAFAVAVFAGRASVAAAKFDEGTQGTRYVSTGGWSGQVDMESGIPVSAGIPHGDEQLIDTRGVDVIPYLSHGILTEADAQAAVGTATGDPYLTDVFVRPGEALSGPDGLAPSATEPQVIPYLSHGLTTADSLGMPAVRPDDVANRFAHSDVASRPQLASSSGGPTIEWNEALTVGIGAFVLVLGLGLALGYFKRPRLAGL